MSKKFWVCCQNAHPESIWTSSNDRIPRIRILRDRISRGMTVVTISKQKQYDFHDRYIFQFLCFVIISHNVICVSTLILFCCCNNNCQNPLGQERIITYSTHPPRRVRYLQDQVHQQQRSVHFKNHLPTSAHGC